MAMKYAVCRQIGGEADTFYQIVPKAGLCVKIVPPLKPLLKVESVHRSRYAAAARAHNETLRTRPGSYEYGTSRKGYEFLVLAVDGPKKGDTIAMPGAEAALKAE